MNAHLRIGSTSIQVYVNICVICPCADVFFVEEKGQGDVKAYCRYWAKTIAVKMVWRRALSLVRYLNITYGDEKLPPNKKIGDISC